MAFFTLEVLARGAVLGFDRSFWTDGLNLIDLVCSSFCTIANFAAWRIHYSSPTQADFPAAATFLA